MNAATGIVVLLTIMLLMNADRGRAFAPELQRRSQV